MEFFTKTSLVIVANQRYKSFEKVANMFSGNMSNKKNEFLEAVKIADNDKVNILLTDFFYIYCGMTEKNQYHVFTNFFEKFNLGKQPALLRDKDKILHIANNYDKIDDQLKQMDL